MAFSSWSALRAAIKDALANHIAGEPCIGEYEFKSPSGARRFRYRSFDELLSLYRRTYEMEALDQSGDRSVMVSYARPRRFS